MATTFFLRTKRKNGYAPICIRVQSSVLKINIRQSTNLIVSIPKWNLSRSSRNFRNFLYSPEGHVLFEKLEEIRLTIDKRVKDGVRVTGHSSIAMLKKYIKASELECANMIRSDAAFAVWSGECMNNFM